MSKLAAALFVSGVLAHAPAAEAALLHGPYEYPSAVAFEGGIGLQGGMGGYTPGGFKLELGYTHRFVTANQGLIGVWFFGNLDGVIGPGIGVCGDNPVYECDSVGYGSAFEIKSGIQLTFRTPYPVVPYARVGLGLAFAFGRDRCDDSGVAVPLHVVGGGARYFFTRHVAATLGLDLELGPAFYSGGNCAWSPDRRGGDHNEFWRSMSLVGGVQYAL